MTRATLSRTATSPSGYVDGFEKAALEKTVGKGGSEGRLERWLEGRLERMARKGGLEIRFRNK
jgi:hypothetical protein